MLPSRHVIGMPVTAVRFNDQLALMLEWAERRQSRMVCVANVHMLMEAHRRPEFASTLQAADLVAPDGTPLVWMLRLLGARYQDRVAGMDLMPELCALAAQRRLSVYFLGSTPEVLEALRARLAREYPGLAIAGTESPPFRALSPEEDDAIVRRIRDSGAHLVLVALGCPKQEQWMHAHLDRLSAVMVGLGGAFPVFAGMHKMAPAWMRASGFEWLYRLAQEPRRLWWRYWQTNLPFVWLALGQLITRRA